MMTSRHQMETFSALLAICAGNSPVPGEFPTQRPVTQSFDFFSLICVWINGWVNNREAADLRRYRAHYDVTVMIHASRARRLKWYMLSVDKYARYGCAVGNCKCKQHMFWKHNFVITFCIFLWWRIIVVGSKGTLTYTFAESENHPCSNFTTVL